VELVRYPGLLSDPSHAVAKQHLTSFGSVISFDVVESTVERPAAVPGQHHLPPGLLRLSVGIEHVEDIWEDLNRAL